MFDFNKIQAEHLGKIDILSNEISAIYNDMVLSATYSKLNYMPFTLYGYMMGIFSRIDLLSSCWQGDSLNQTQKMISFMDRYFLTPHQANSLTIQEWRHSLMHTGEPRYLVDRKSNIKYRWLLQWSNELPRNQHFTFTETGDSIILNLGLIYLVDDLKESTKRYLSDLETSIELQKKYRKYQLALDSYPYKPY